MDYYKNTRNISILALLIVAAPICIGANQWELPGYKGLFAGDRVLYIEEIITKSIDDLGFIRNEIFARYGRKFQTPKYDQYFKSQPWYFIRENYSDTMLTETDKENIALILTLEKPKMSRQETIKSMIENIEYFDPENSVTIIISGDQELIVNEESYYGESDYGSSDFGGSEYGSFGYDEFESSEYGSYEFGDSEYSSSEYGSNPFRRYVVHGDWIITMADFYFEAFLLNHRSKSIEKSAVFDFTADFLEFFESLSHE